MNITHIEPRSPDGNVRVFVEIPRGSMNKYEFDKTLGVLTLDRTLYSAVHYPADYGFVPGTRSGDGELLDALILVEHPVFPGCLVETRLIGVLTIQHEGGQPEGKLLAVPVNDPRFNEYHDIADVPEHVLKEIENFFDIFKELEGRDLGVLGWEGVDRAERALEEAMAAYNREGAS